MSIITTEKRSSDWIVFAFDDRQIWEAGATENEAAGKLILRLTTDSVPLCEDCAHYGDGGCAPGGPMCMAFESATHSQSG